MYKIGLNMSSHYVGHLMLVIAFFIEWKRNFSGWPKQGLTEEDCLDSISLTLSSSGLGQSVADCPET